MTKHEENRTTEKIYEFNNRIYDDILVIDFELPPFPCPSESVRENTRQHASLLKIHGAGGLLGGSTKSCCSGTCFSRASNCHSSTTSCLRIGSTFGRALSAADFSQRSAATTRNAATQHSTLRKCEDKTRMRCSL